MMEQCVEALICRVRRWHSQHECRVNNCNDRLALGIRKTNLLMGGVI